MTSPLDIVEFYRGKNIFVTGGTGFVGKVLIEKLLRSCSGLKRLYLLVREKKGKEPQERIQQLLSSKLFERLKEEQPDFWKQVSCISGDMELPNLGMSPEDYHLISKEISVVFHLGASVRFDENLKVTLCRNLCGTKHLIDLAKEIEGLQALVHVSTAYCNTQDKDIYEKVYPTEFRATDIISCLPWMTEDLFEKMKPTLLSRHPNNYCYSKCLAEQLLTEEAGSLPVVIVRPTMVVSTYKEPVQGWIDTYNGITLSVVALSKGFLRTLFCPKESMDYIPVDLCVNLILASAWHRANKGPRSLIVYNCSTTTANAACTKQRWRRLWQLYIEYPSMEACRYPSFSFTKYKAWNEISHFYSHLLPAVFVDTCLFILGKKTRMVSQYRKLRTLEKETEYFVSNQWNFHADNFKSLLNSMSETDKRIFDIDVRNIDWNTFMINFVLYARQYLLNEDPKTIPMARKRLRRLYYVDLFSHIAVIGGILYVLPFGVWDTITDFFYSLSSSLLSLMKVFFSC